MLPLAGILLPVAIAGILIASPLCPMSLREIELVLVGMFFFAAIKPLWSQRRRNSRRVASKNGDERYLIETLEELRAVLPEGLSGGSLEDAKKVLECLDDQMMDFIQQSPLVYLATVDVETQTPFVSPKGDEPGFVTVLTEKGNIPRHTLVIPDRPGNRLLFGLQNIVRCHDQESNGKSTNHSLPHRKQHVARASLLFVVPGTSTTLRCGGFARISTDPKLLRDHAARGLPPKLVVLVDVDHAFFHCAKAYLRGRVWNPEAWPSDPPKVGFGRYFARKDSFLARRIDFDVEQHYRKVQKAIDGESCEVEP